MLQPLGISLNKTVKSRLWSEALLYTSLVEIINNELGREYLDFEVEFKNLKVFYKNQDKFLEVKLVSTNLPFLTWLKTEIEILTEFILQRLFKKNIVKPNCNLILKCVGR